MPGHTRLYRRENGIYYFRAKVPQPLRPVLNLTEIRVSLKTTDYRKAHRDWHNDIEDLGALFSNHLPNYRCLINSFMAGQKSVAK